MSRGSYEPSSAPADGQASSPLFSINLRSDNGEPSSKFPPRPDLNSPILRYPQPSSHFPPPKASPHDTPLPAYLSRLPLSLPTLHLIHANTGLLLVASSQIFFVGMGLSAKYFISSTSLSTLTLIFVRMGITALISLGWLTYTGNPNPALGPPDPPKIRRMLIMRGFFGFGGLFANYQSLRGLSLSDSVTIQFLAPNLTALLGWLVLREKLGWREVAAGMACLGGVVLVSRPPFLFGVAAGGTGGEGVGEVDMPGEGVDTGISHADRMVAVAWAFTAVTFASCAYISIRKIGKQAHAMHSMLYFCYACLITSFIGLLIEIRTFVFLQSWKEFWLIMLIGAFGFIAQILLTFGLQREKAGRAGLAMYLSLFYSLLFEAILFGTIPPFLSLLGAFIIISSAVWVALSKKTESSPDDTSNRYERVQTDEESQPVSGRSTPIEMEGMGRESDEFTARGSGYGANGSGVLGELQVVVEVEDGEGKKGGVRLRSDSESEKTGQEMLKSHRSLLRRKSSGGSGKILLGSNEGNRDM